MPTPQEARGTVPAIESVGFLLVPGFALMSYASAVEPLRAANRLSGKTLYRWWHAAPADQPAIASSGAALLPDFTFGSPVGRLDLLLVCAGGNPAEFNDKRTFTWLRKLARKGVTIGGVSGGPFILAKAGLLAGRRCSVHWEHIGCVGRSAAEQGIAERQRPERTRPDRRSDTWISSIRALKEFPT